MSPEIDSIRSRACPGRSARPVSGCRIQAYRLLLLTGMAATLPGVADAQNPPANDAALIERLVLDRATVIALLHRRDEEPEGARLLMLAEEDRAIREGSDGLSEAATIKLMEITAARSAAAQSLSLRDESFALALQDFREGIEPWAQTQGVRSALQAYADGERVQAWQALLTATLGAPLADPAMTWCGLVQLTADRFDRDELKTEDIRTLWTEFSSRLIAASSPWFAFGDLNLRASLLQEAADAYTIAEAYSDTPRSRMIAAGSLCDVVRREGLFEAAMAHCDRALLLARQLAAGVAVDDPALRDLSRLLLHVGDAAGEYRWKAAPPTARDETLAINEHRGYTAHGRTDLADAREAFGESLDIARARLAAAPSDVQDRMDVAIRLRRLAIVHEDMGLQVATRRYLKEAISHYEQVAALAPGSVVTQRQIAWLHVRIGDTSLFQPSAAHERALALFRAIAGAQPNNESARRELTLALHDVGDHVVMTLVHGGASPEIATKFFYEALAIRSVAAGKYPNDTGTQRDLAASLVRLGQSHPSADKRKQHLEEAFRILVRLAELEPESEQRQHEVDAVRRALTGMGVAR